jgi:eukaryotic-like serine/threonine-protein kinase
VSSVRQNNSAVGVMVDQSLRCPLCDEPALFGTEVPAACPFQGEAGCPLGSALTELPDDDLLAETIAHDALDPRWEPDGFPVEDDLVDHRLGQYLLGPVIGHGSMGRVYQAEHAGLGRTCAIKVMNPGLVARQPQIVDRFWAEARAVAHVIHPNIVTVHNLGSDRGYHYIEMEYVPGGVSLKEILIRQGALEPLRATTLVRQVVLALGAAHRLGLIHRDVKPANVLLASGGVAKLADFGLVRRLGDRDRTGAPVAGTPTFMAPELFTGGTVGPASDLYAVGVMFFYLLTARLPFSSDNLGRLIRMHRTAPVPNLRHLAPEVPQELAAIVTRLLAKRAEDRPASAEDLSDDLRAIQGQLRDTEELVTESLEGLGGFVQHGGKDQFRVVLPVPGNRLQEVYIEVIEGRKSERLLSVFSVCAPADARHYEFALKLNAELTYGGLSIRNVNGQPMFVMTRVYPRGHVSPADIRAAVLEIARRGDWVEQQLTRDDVF